MPLPSSGKITTQTFRDFFEIDANTPISSSDWYRGGPYVRANYQSQNQGVKSINNQVPTSGRITLSDLYGVYKVVNANNLVPGNTNPNNTNDNVPGNENTQDSQNNLNPPNNDYGAGPAGIYEDSFNNAPDGGTAGNQNPPTGNADYTQHFGNNTDVNYGGNPPPPLGDGSDATTKDGFWVYADSKPPGNYNPPNNDYGAGPSGIYEDAFANNPDGGTIGNPGATSGGDAGAGPGGAYEDPTTNPVTPNDPNINSSYWSDHEKLV